MIQPWASLIALGHKKVETRSWTTNYRGPLAIHAAKGYPNWAREFADDERTLGRIPAELPLGAVIAVAKLVDVRRTEDVVESLSPLERHLGDYDAGRFAWFLEDVEVPPVAIPARGALQLWEWDAPGGLVWLPAVQGSTAEVES